MWAAVAQRARWLRAVRPRPARAGPRARSGDGSNGISAAKMGRTGPLLARFVRRAAARTAATRGWADGEATPAAVLSASIAQTRDFVCEYPTSPAPRSERNSAKTRGSAGSQATPRAAANVDQARSGPRYRFHVCGARLSSIARTRAGGAGAPSPARTAAAAANISAAPPSRRLRRLGRPARRRTRASRISSRSRSSNREIRPPVAEAESE
jgi:hypothetical protein